MRRLVGLNLDVNAQKPTELRIARSYCNAVEKSGGVPLLLPPMSGKSLERALETIDALVLIAGGRDYSPETYGEVSSPLINPLDPDRQEFDLRLTRRALKRRELPILGICGGMQLINIALGGTLWYDIAEQYPVQGQSVSHRGKDQAAQHSVSLASESNLARIYRAKKIGSVVSSHHQAIKELGKRLRIIGTADDGIIEAIEMLNRNFVIGVQWHPERGTDLRVFRAMMQQAERYAESKTGLTTVL